MADFLRIDGKGVPLSRLRSFSNIATSLELDIGVFSEREGYAVLSVLNSCSSLRRFELHGREWIQFYMIGKEMDRVMDALIGNHFNRGLQYVHITLPVNTGTLSRLLERYPSLEEVDVDWTGATLNEDRVSLTSLEEENLKRALSQAKSLKTFVAKVRIAYMSPFAAASQAIALDRVSIRCNENVHEPDPYFENLAAIKTKTLALNGYFKHGNDTVDITPFLMKLSENQHIQRLELQNVVIGGVDPAEIPLRENEVVKEFRLEKYEMSEQPSALFLLRGLEQLEVPHPFINHLPHFPGLKKLCLIATCDFKISDIDYGELT